MKPLFYISLILLTACSASRAIRTPNGYTFSVKGKFHLKGQTKVDTSHLSVSNVYITYCDEWKQGFKFFSNGRVAYLNFIRYEDKSTRILYSGGYYTVEGKTIIIEMSYGVSNGMITGDEWDVIKIQGEISGDTLKFYKDQWQGKGKNMKAFTGIKNTQHQDCYYIKTNESYNIPEPDWN